MQYLILKIYMYYLSFEFNFFKEGESIGKMTIPGASWNDAGASRVKGFYAPYLTFAFAEYHHGFCHPM
jgi:hypothetical protein